MAFKRGRLASMLLYFSLVILAFAFATLSVRPTVEQVGDPADLRRFDFSSKIARINASSFDWYPQALYTPEDFAAGVKAAPETERHGSSQYGTYRLVLSLPENETGYGISGYSAAYAQTLWLEGNEAFSIGKPGQSIETSEPKTNYFTYYFRPAAQQSEIVIQRSNFVHAAGGQLYPLYLGEQAMITAYTSGNLIRGILVVGCMLTASLFFCGVYLFFRKQPQFLWFSIACLLIMVRTLYTDHRLIMLFFPKMSWYTSHRIEYLVTIGFVYFFLLYVVTMFRWRVGRGLAVLAGCILGAYCLLMLLTPSTVYTRAIPALQAGALLITGVIFTQLVRFALRKAAFWQEALLVLFSVLCFIALTLVDVVRSQYNGLLDDLNLIQLGMMIMVFANMLALTLTFANTESSLQKAKANEREMQETNRMLERLNVLRGEFLANIAHEMKTPLMVMSGYAQLALWQVESGTTDGDTKNNLETISWEAQRLSYLVDELLNNAIGNDGRADRRPIPIDALAQRAGALCRPVLKTNNNLLQVDADAACPPVFANMDMLLQVLLNLITNANRHSRDATVYLTIHREAEYAVFCVRDEGIGIDPKLLPRVFERTVSGEGGSGLGLAICRDVIESHGGEITLSSEPGMGTSVLFKLPLADDGADAHWAG